MPLLIVVALTVLLIAWLVAEPWLVEWRRQRLRRQPFPLAWRRILRRRWPYLRRLPADLQIQLKRHMLVFLKEKAFIGCRGLTVTDEMRVTVAAQACLLLLNRPAGRTDYFPGLRQVLLYPGPFVVDRVHGVGAGVLQNQRRVLAGESWSQGQVILSWDDVLSGAAMPQDGHNVVIHEFAHQLDQDHGPADGAPWLGSRARQQRWSQVMNDEYALLQQRLQMQQPSLLSAYAATEPAEFFAVASEVFYSQPARLAAEHPALYRELRDCYRVDPLSW